MANPIDDLINRLRALGMSDDAARAAARAAQNAPPVPSRSFDLPVGDMTPPPSTPRFDGITAGNVPSAPDFSLGSPLWNQMDKGARSYENLRTGRTANLRNQNPDLVRVAQQNIQDANAYSARSQAQMLEQAAANKEMLQAGAGIGATAAAVYGLFPGGNNSLPPGGDKSPPPQGSTTADLAAESRPVPPVPATNADGWPREEAQFLERFKRQYLAREERRKRQGEGGYADPSDKAKAILDDLNARRRKAGGEVPEAKQMMAEANRLLAMGNAQRNAPGYTPRDPSNPREQAQILLQKLNADRMEAGGEVPHSRQVMAEVERLQKMYDQGRWPTR
jgi:hypothetical protein